VPETQHPDLRGRRAEPLEKIQELALWLPWEPCRWGKLGMIHTSGLPSRGLQAASVSISNIIVWDYCDPMVCKHQNIKNLYTSFGFLQLVVSTTLNWRWIPNVTACQFIFLFFTAFPQSKFCSKSSTWNLTRKKKTASFLDCPATLSHEKQIPGQFSRSWILGG